MRALITIAARYSAFAPLKIVWKLALPTINIPVASHYDKVSLAQVL